MLAAISSTTSPFALVEPFGAEYFLRVRFRLDIQPHLPDQRANGQHHPPAGLQRGLLLRATHNDETAFEFAARLAGRVHAVLCGLSGKRAQ